MAQFRLKPKEMNIRVLSAPGVTWKVVPMTASEDQELAKKFQEYDTRSKGYIISDDMGLLKARAIQVIRGFCGLPGEDGEIEYSTVNLEALCEMHTQVIADVLNESRRADALVVEATEKNS